MDNEKIKDKEEKRGIFLGIIGVLTLIVAIIGASFAYFSINARSQENAVKVEAASVQIVYDDGNKLELENLIPSEKSIASKAYTRTLESDIDYNSDYEECIDDNGKRVCGVYEFTLTNNGTSDVTFDIKVKQEDNEETTDTRKFRNLSYILSDVSETNSVGQINTGYLSVLDSVTGEYEDVNLLSGSSYETSKLSIQGNGVTKKYRLFVWLNAETDSDGHEIAQDDEQGAIFQGTVHIEVGEAYITGKINQ